MKITSVSYRALRQWVTSQLEGTQEVYKLRDERTQLLEEIEKLKVERARLKSAIEDEEFEKEIPF